MFIQLIAIVILTAALAGPQTEVIKPTDPAVLNQEDKWKALAMYREFLLAQKDYELLYQQFLADDKVRETQQRLLKLRDGLQKLEAQMLAAKELHKDEYFLDFATGEIKRVPAK
jgi:hypothetical protein